MTSAASSKYFVSVSRTSSESRSSAKGVKPTRSANKTLTRRRSATVSFRAPGAFGATGAAAAGAAERVPSGVAHSEQNFAFGRLTNPQLGHPDTSGDAHSMQNFAPGMFWVPQAPQIKLDEAYLREIAPRGPANGRDSARANNSADASGRTRHDFDGRCRPQRMRRDPGGIHRTAISRSDCNAGRARNISHSSVGCVRQPAQEGRRRLQSDRERA